MLTADHKPPGYQSQVERDMGDRRGFRKHRALGLDMAGNPQTVYLARVLAVRDLVLACGAYATDGEVQRQWLLAGLVCDSADTLAGIAAGAADTCRSARAST